MRSILRAALSVCLCGVLFCACQRDEPHQVRLDERSTLAPAPEEQAPALTVAVGSMITPQAGYGYYRQLIDYLSARLQLRVEAIDPGNYAKTNALLASGEADFAFVCGGPYVSGHDSFGLELLAAPVVKGETVYYSYLIVPADSPVRSFAELRGKSFAFTDPQSNSGKLVPTAMLARLGSTPEQFFSSTTFTYGHDRSIQAVADRIVDGAAVDSLIWDYLSAADPKLQERVRVVERFGPFAIPPVVAAPHVPLELREKFRQALLTMHQDPQGQTILQGMHIDRFTPIDDDAYESIRQMLNTIGQEKP